MILRVRQFKNCESCSKSETFGVADKKTVVCLNPDYRELFESDGDCCASYCDGYESCSKDNRGMILIPDALDFMTSGHAEFTLYSTKTNETFTYSMVKKEIPGENKRVIYWLSMNTGSQLQYAGSVYYSDKDSSWTFSKGKKGNIENSNISIRSLLFVLNKLSNSEIVRNCEIYHMGKCRYCRRKLEYGDDFERCQCLKCSKIHKNKK